MIRSPDIYPTLPTVESRWSQAGEIELVPADREITIQDLLRHTSGLTYEFRGTGPVHKMYSGAKIFSRTQTSTSRSRLSAKCRCCIIRAPAWEYSRSTDVIGRLIELLSGLRLGVYLERHHLSPLGMVDTAFHVPERDHSRLAEAFARDPESGEALRLLEVRDPPNFESGGGGLVSTASDYARFLQMLLNNGTLNGVRLLSRKTIELMTADHLGPITGAPDLLLPGYGFGLGFAVRLHAGIAHTPGSIGQYFSGWPRRHDLLSVDPAEQLIALLLIPGTGPARLLPSSIPRPRLLRVCEPRAFARGCRRAEGGWIIRSVVIALRHAHGLVAAFAFDCHLPNQLSPDIPCSASSISNFCSLKRARSRLPTGTGAGKRTLLSP